MIDPAAELLSPRRAQPGAAVGYGWAVLLAGAALGVAVLLNQRLDIADLSLLFVLPVVIVAANFSLGAALTAAALGAAGFNFFLIQPLYTFSIADSAQLWGLVLLLAVAVIVSAVADEARRRAEEARGHAARAIALQGLARGLVGANTRSEIVAETRAALTAIFDAPSVVLLSGEDGGLENDGLTDAELQAAGWALSTRLSSRADAYPPQNATYDFWPVITPSRLGAVIGVRLDGRSEGRPGDIERLLDIVGGHLAVALERRRFAAQAQRAAVIEANDRVKADLLAAVSHDLRTPLSTVLVALQSLQRFGGDHDEATRDELLSLAESETARLAALVGNLLDMGRIDAGAMVVRIEPTALADLVATALDRARPALSGRAIENAVDGEGLNVLVDPGLAATAIGNLLDNAGKYAPAGSTVRIDACAEDGKAVISIVDEGPGLPSPHDHLFERFERGVSGDGRPPGTGLGLSIARGFLAAQGGSVEAANRAERAGARLTVRLPLASA